jgi:hypothetical protein
VSITFEAFAPINDATVRVHRAPRVTLLDDVAGLFALRRAARLAVTGDVTRPVEMRLVHPLPQVRLTDGDAAGAVFLLRRGHKVAIGESAPTPSGAYFFLGAPGPAIRMATRAIYHDELIVHHAPRVLLDDGDGGRFLVHHYPAVYLSDGAQTMTRIGFLLQQPSLAGSTGALGIAVSVSSRLALANIVLPQHIAVRRARLRLALDGASTLDGEDAARADLALDAAAAISIPVLVRQALGLTADALPSREVIVQATDALALLAGPGTTLAARNVVAEALALDEAAARVVRAQVTALLGLAAMADDDLDGMAHALDALRLAGTPAGGVTFTALVEDRAALGDAVASRADLVTRIREGLELLATIHLPSGTYLAWVLHGDTRAYTRYTNFPFNSFCELGGRYFGATDTGIYELTGDDDAGEPIAAHVRAGLSDMGTGKLKRMESLYLGYRADGAMVLKVVTTSDAGAKREDWYALETRPADAVREGRVKIGRGLKSRYWGFELANVDGGDFALDSLEWLPMVLERRI